MVIARQQNKEGLVANEPRSWDGADCRKSNLSVYISNDVEGLSPYELPTNSPSGLTAIHQTIWVATRSTGVAEGVDGLGGKERPSHRMVRA